MLARLSGPLFPAAASSFVLTLAVTPLVRGLALRWGCVDYPSNERWGRRVVARLGGVAMLAGCIGSALLWVPWERSLIGFFGALLLMFAVGIWDDVRRLRPYTKLLWQFAAGCWLVGWGIRVEHMIPWPWLAVPLSILWFVLIINAFNLLDNMDGLAAGVGAIASIVYTLHAALSHHGTSAILGAIVAGACLGFLRYNFPPAKIYMGDSGSHLLGLSLSALALMETWQHSTQLLSVMALPVLVLAVPIFDTCFVTVQRILHRTHPFQGGRDHVSHRLAILGLSHRQTVLILYAVSAAGGALSLLSMQVRPMTSVAVGLLLLAVVLIGAAYLAKVKVYELKREPLAADATATADVKQPSTRIDTMLMHKRRLLEVLVDFALICGSYVAAHVLRFEGTLTRDVQHLILRSLPIILVIKLGCFALSGLYRGVWRYASLTDVVTIFKGVTLGSICSAAALLYLWRFEGYSRAVFIIDWLLLSMAVSASRVAERLLNEWIAGARASSDAVPMLIIGAGDVGELVLRQVKRDGQPKRRVVGFLDDDPRKIGSRIHGRSVLGTRQALPGVLELYRIREVYIAIGRPPGDLIAHVKSACEPRGVRWRMVTATAPDAD